MTRDSLFHQLNQAVEEEKEAQAALDLLNESEAKDPKEMDAAHARLYAAIAKIAEITALLGQVPRV